MQSMKSIKNLKDSTVIKYTFQFGDNSLVAQIKNPEDDKNILDTIQGTKEGCTSDFIYLKLENGSDSFFNYKNAKVILREVVEDVVEVPLPTQDNLTDSELKDVYGEMPVTKE